KRAARRTDRSWALARRMIGSPPTPYCSAANSNERSLTSLAKLRLIPSPVPHRSHAPQLAYFCGGNPRAGGFPPRAAPASSPPPPAALIPAGFFCGRLEGSRAGRPVGIDWGGRSHWPPRKPTADTLDALGIGYVAKIISAHRTPERHLAFTKAAKAQGFKIIIAGAGGPAHLPGVTAALTTLPLFAAPIVPNVLPAVAAV